MRIGVRRYERRGVGERATVKMSCECRQPRVSDEGGCGRNVGNHGDGVYQKLNSCYEKIEEPSVGMEVTIDINQSRPYYAMANVAVGRIPKWRCMTIDVISLIILQMGFETGPPRILYTTNV